MRSFSLGTRIALIILVGTIATVGSVLLIAYSALVDDFETILTEQQLYETRRISAEVDQRLQLKLDVLAESASMLSHGDRLHSLEDIGEQLERQRLLQSLFPDGILVFDDKATAIAETISVPGRIGTNYADRQHIKEAIETRQPVISRPIMGRTTGVPLISFVAPIETDDGDLLGFLGGTINLGETSIIPAEMLSEISNDDARFKVIDTNNFLYIEGGPTPEKGIQSLPPPGTNPLIDAALSGISFGQTQGPDGEVLIYATSHLQKLGWQFVRAVPFDWATAPAEASFGRFLGISLGIAMMIAVVSYLLSRSATTPLDRMTRKIENMVRNTSEAARLDPVGPGEVRNLALAFNRLMDERDSIAQMKEHFVSNVSHELRTPLTSINGALRLIQSGAAGDLPERAQQMNTLALRNGERLQLLISDLLDFSKLSAGQMAVTLGQEPLTPIIEAAVSGNQAMANDHQVTLTAECDPGHTVVADPHRLRQILDNFVSNAIKFSPARGNVKIRVQPGGDQSLRIVVQDNGDGVPESFVERLFERFSQAEAGSTRSNTGTGLGLAICRELIALMHGRIGYYYDQGASFWIELPTAAQKA
ncbi:ATP-binding protein [Marinobacter sp. M216]|uniref:histidine kinase n=1 Tax=Marinobacter albus TaxID=3030833 RepID=A0ABT7H884_9GAMM|nr:MULTISPECIES: ATP-binding protein [unclassified Marinobacter]MBW7471465.1 HAMP domain-containing protein [Marinobacter sp. F4218]MDK9556257.1 ATP-binding protein [Marinobacter sp. M216]